MTPTWTVWRVSSESQSTLGPCVHSRPDAAIQLPGAPALRLMVLSVEIPTDGYFPKNRRADDPSPPLRRARPSYLCFGTLRSHGYGSWHCGSPVAFPSILQRVRLYRAVRVCTSASVPQTSAGNSGTEGTTGASGASRPDRLPGSTGAGRARRHAWSTWSYRICGTNGPRGHGHRRRRRVYRRDRCRRHTGRHGVCRRSRGLGHTGRYRVCRAHGTGRPVQIDGLRRVLRSHAA